MTMKVGLIAMVLATAGCGGVGDVQCEEDTNCGLEAGGLCTVAPSGNQWCTYEDSTCESGRRWSDLDVGDGLSGECVGDTQLADGGAADAPVGDIADAGSDAAQIDAEMPDAALGDWQLPVILANVNTVDDDFGPAISPNGLELYYTWADGPTNRKIMVATRASTATPFGTPSEVAAVNNDGREWYPFVTADGLELWYSTVVVSSFVLHVSTRASLVSPWQAPTNTGITASKPSLTSDRLQLYYIKNCPDNFPCVYRRTRSTTSSPWSSEELVPLPPGVHGDGTMSMNFQYVHVSSNGLGLLLSGPLSGTASRVAETWRPSLAVDWDASALTPINALAFDTTHNGARWNHSTTEIYLFADKPAGEGGDDLYVSRRE